MSRTINGPAPILLAMYMNTAIDQQREQREAGLGRPLTEAELAEVRAYVLKTVRGTVQADILKEDQAQNTCIFSSESAGWPAASGRWPCESATAPANAARS